MLALGHSFRRALLEEELTALAPTFRGLVVDVGGKRPPRGRWAPPAAGAARWLVLNVELRERPDVVADARALPLRAASVDALLCLETLQYVAQPDAALAEMARALARGGRAIVSVPFLHRADGAADRHRFTEVGLRELFGQTGLHVTRLSPQGAFFTTLANFLRQATARIPNRALRYGVAVLVLPLSESLRGLDRLPAVRRSPFLSSFTTGFLLVGERA